MPHSTGNDATNGSSPAATSKFLSQVGSYPVVTDTVNTIKNNPYGAKTLELADGAYQKFGKPVEPYLETPYSYAKPYVTKADELASSGLGKVEERFPIVKEDTQTVVGTAKSYVFWPSKLVGDGRDYVLGTWNGMSSVLQFYSDQRLTIAVLDEYTKTSRHNSRGSGLQTSVLALVSTQLKISSDFFQLIADFLGPKYEESKKKSADYVSQAQDTAQHYGQVGREKLDQYAHVGQQKSEEILGQAKEGKEQAKSSAREGKEQVKERAGGK